MRDTHADHDLQDMSQWDHERAEERGPSKGARAVVSVALAREDFDRITQCAQREGMRTSEFIRQAALDRVAQHGRPARVLSITDDQGGFRRTQFDATAAPRWTVRSTVSDNTQGRSAVLAGNYGD